MHVLLHKYNRIIRTSTHNPSCNLYGLNECCIVEKHEWTKHSFVTSNKCCNVNYEVMLQT